MHDQTRDVNSLLGVSFFFLDLVLFGMTLIRSSLLLFQLIGSWLGITIRM
jgi:hypothetical protein